MNIRCDTCKKEVGEEEMLWVVWEDRDICRGCYSRQLKEGKASIVMPHLATILDG